MAIEIAVRTTLASILATGLLRIRSYGEQGLAQRCSSEADHLHNLPGIIARPSLQMLFHYFEVERPAFVSCAVGVEQFETDWNRLRTLIEELRSQSDSFTQLQEKE